MQRHPHELLPYLKSTIIACRLATTGVNEMFLSASIWPGFSIQRTEEVRIQRDTQSTTSTKFSREILFSHLLFRRGKEILRLSKFDEFTEV